MTAPARILVTGGAGFIGSSLVRQLIAETDSQVMTLDSLTYAGHLANLGQARNHPRHAFRQADIAVAEQIRAALLDFRPTAIMHLAAESHVDRSITGPAAFVNTNVVGTFNLLEECLSYWRSLPDQEAAAFRFLHVSTDEVYGSLEPTDAAFSERSRYQPNSPYSASKAAADHMVRAWFHTFGFPAVTTNCSNNYGPFQYPEKLIPLMITRALNGESMPVYGAGNQVRDWLYVEDHARALRLVLGQGRLGEVYCIGGDAERINLDVVHAICDVLDELSPREQSFRTLIRHVQDRPGHDLRYSMDFGKLRAELGWTPGVDFRGGLAATVKWYLDNRDWCRLVMTDQTRGLSGDTIGRDA